MSLCLGRLFDYRTETQPMDIYGLIGNPIGHSFSKQLFNDWFENEKIDAVYQSYQLNNINSLIDLINDNINLIGLNVTYPFKRECLRFIDELTDDARIVDAVNTIYIDRQREGRNGTFRLVGHNTDISGFASELAESGIVSEAGAVCGDGLRALVLGSGGAASAVCAALLKYGVQPLVVSRRAINSADKSAKSCANISAGRGELPPVFEKVDFISYDSLTAEIIDTHRIIIDTTPLGMGDLTGKAPDIPYNSLTSDHLCIDLVYNPSVTEFMTRCASRGACVKNGLSMLYGQARASRRFWQSQKLLPPTP